MEREINIDDLTDSCIWNIFQYFTIADRLIAGKVCQRWHELERSSSHQVQVFDCFDPNWLLIFDEATPEFEYDTLFENLMSQYGSYIEYLKYKGSKIYESVPVFPLTHIINVCHQLRCIKRFENVLIRACHLSSIVRYEKIIEFRSDSSICLSLFMKKLFSINDCLECVYITVTDGTRDCLRRLADKPIKELGIIWKCRRVPDLLKSVIKSLTQLKILDVTYPESLIPDRLLKAISRRTELIKLRIRTVGFSDRLIESLAKLPNLIELNLQQDTTIADSFLRRLVSVSPQLKCLNISGCKLVTDEGIRNISKLSWIEKLYVHGLRIKGHGLIEIKSLRYLSCRDSTIFDKALCQILHLCPLVEYLDIAACQNVTVKTIECAKRITNFRDNRIKLKINLDYELLNAHWVEGSGLLEFVCERSSLLHSETSQYRLLKRSNGKSNNIMDQTIMSLDTNYSTDMYVPGLNDDCLYHIFSFLSILEQFAMRNVSERWEGLLDRQLRVAKTIDLSTAEWNYLKFDKTVDEMNNIITKLLRILGEGLKELKLNEANLLQICTNLCPNLESLYLWVSNTEVSPLIWIHNCCNLTTISLGFQNSRTVDNPLGRIFEYNQCLKSVSLFWIRNLRFTCLLRLNSRVIEKLHLYSVYMHLNTEFAQIRLNRALSSFKNLKDLLVVPGNFSSKCIMESFQGDSNLEILTLVYGWDDIEFQGDFQQIFQLQCLETLVLHSYLIVDDNILVELRNRCQMLSHIDITGCKNVTDEGLRIISTIPNLHTLIINKLTKIRGSGLSSSPSLRHLECEQCYSIRNGPLCRVVENCSNLEFLNVVDCPKLNDQIINTAFEVVSRRTNNVLLKLFTNLPSARPKRSMAPLLLKIFFKNEP